MREEMLSRQLDRARKKIDLLEKMAEDRTRELYLSNRELQRFIYIASHDLQEPLRKFSIFSSRFNAKYRGQIDQEGNDYLERMYKAAEKMQAMIRDLLMYSKVMSGGRPFVSVDLSRTARDVLTELQSVIDRTNGRVDLDNLHVIQGDPVQIRMLLQNLIGNALKYRHKNRPPVIKVSGRFVGRNGPEAEMNPGAAGSYQLKVEDNGIGFDNKYRDIIFAVFKRLHTSREYEGTGIGLSVCKKIVEHHHGSLTSVSSPGCGSSFVATLPVNRREG